MNKFVILSKSIKLHITLFLLFILLWNKDNITTIFCKVYKKIIHKRKSVKNNNKHFYCNNKTPIFSNTAEDSNILISIPGNSSEDMKFTALLYFDYFIKNVLKATVT